MWPSSDGRSCLQSVGGFAGSSTPRRRRFPKPISLLLGQYLCWIAENIVATVKVLCKQRFWGQLNDRQKKKLKSAVSQWKLELQRPTTAIIPIVFPARAMIRPCPIVLQRDHCKLSWNLLLIAIESTAQHHNPPMPDSISARPLQTVLKSTLDRNR